MTMLRDRPILFNAHMIRAILREIERLGTGKTMTRRLIKPQPTVHESGYWSWEGRNGGFVGSAGTAFEKQFPKSVAFWGPYQVGDRLWVREAHYLTDDGEYDRVVYAADEIAVAEHREAIQQMQADLHLSDRWAASHLKLRTSIHMPRWASRITLTVTDVKVERLQDISEADAQAEGVQRDTDGWFDYLMPGTQCCLSAVESFRTLWTSINGQASWDANPWVVAITFDPELRNIDQEPAR